MAITTKGKHWYNNGKIQIFAFECPDGFVPGRFKNSKEFNKKLSQVHKQKHYHWYNNGIIQVQAAECPDGFEPGCLPTTEETRKRLSESHIGTKHPISNTTKEKISKAKKGKYGSNGHVGFKVSEETKQKISYKIASAEVQQYRNAIMKQNKTFNSSKPEEDFYQALLLLFPKEDIKRQYRDSRYPFNCDFYIYSLDLFIELNLSWTHGGHKYDKKAKCDQLKEAFWREKAKTSKYYKLALDTWMHRDIIKIHTAKLNKLNYLMAYNNKDIEEILNYLKAKASSIV